MANPTKSSHNLKVLFIHQNLTGNTGEAVESKQTILSLLRQGVTVGALYRRYDAPALDSPEGNYVDLGCPNFDLKSIASRIDSFKPDIGHIKSCWTPFHAKTGWLLRRRNIRYVIEPGGHFLPVLFTTRFAGRPYGLWRRLLKRGYRALVDEPLLRGAAIMRAMSPHEADYCKATFGVETTALPLGINHEWYIPNPTIRRKPSEAKLKFLFVGRLDIFQKGLDLVLDAVRLLNNSGMDSLFDVTLAGPPLGDSNVKLGELIKQAGLNNISVVPPVFGNDKYDLFNASHVFLHPSRFEEMAKLPREVVATGMAVISSRESNLGDWAESFGFGLAVDLASESLATAMREFIENDTLLSSCSASAITYANEHSWDLIAKDLVPVYHSALSK